MRPKISALGKRALTLVTLIRFLAGVSAHVNFERAGAHELVGADLAYVGPFTRVPPLVVGQVALGGEAHVAVREVTLKGLLPVVYAHVRE